MFNVRRKRAMTNLVKDVRKSKSSEDLSKAFQAIDKAAKRGVIKKNTASRKKARLAKALASKN